MQQKIHVTEKGLEELGGLDYDKCAINKGNAAVLRTGIVIGSKAYQLTVVTGDRKEALLAFQHNWKPVLGSDDHY
ncbi:hypothetical protein J7J00_19490 [Bacillus sp. ISL-4]|uniref:hypothetical protein n=1 Tax=Bacillus sp. ISL-4 TaxID=2819125 RepID=UPI001BE6619B|nr:hypothetical protein [Bacillus sp. ISL-4]MBT2667638.1 hypothetical protein [Bacillus sp. ISL-4]MBT2672329.1 hypothetical protein [Streptomyces sp. ISL-14]